jgi:hypothetical protein
MRKMLLGFIVVFALLKVGTSRAKDGKEARGKGRQTNYASCPVS